MVAVPQHDARVNNIMVNRAHQQNRLANNFNSNARYPVIQ